jgi:prevent-host-death family protein
MRHAKSASRQDESSIEIPSQTCLLRAAQYVRMSTEHQKYSLDNQSAAIALYAAAHGIGIVRSFSDSGKSGLRVNGREALQDLLRIVESGKADFAFILVYDVSRWGRFLDADESAHYEYLCKRAGIQIRYCAEQFENDNSTTANLLKALKRTMAGEYSRELSAKVFAGRCHLFKLGYRMGGLAGFGLRRQLIDEQSRPKQLLADGEHKSIQTDRIRLVHGPAGEVALVRRIYDLFTKKALRKIEIVRWLNSRGLLQTRSRPWTPHSVNAILTNPKYAGMIVRNRSACKLGGKRTWNPPGVWLRQENGVEPIISKRQFADAQKIVKDRNSRGVSNETLIADLRRLLCSTGTLSGKVLAGDRDSVGKQVYIRRFGSIHTAFRLVGFEPKHDTSFVMTRRRLPNILRDETSRLVEKLRAAGAYVATDTTNALLTVNDQFTIRLAMSRYYRHAGGKWLLCLNHSPIPDVLISQRVSSDGTLLDYFIVPTQDVAEPTLTIRAENRLNVNVYRTNDLDRFIQSVRRIPLTVLADPAFVWNEIRPPAIRGETYGITDCPRSHWHTPKMDVLQRKINRTERLIQSAVSAVLALLRDENVVNLLRAESLGSIPLGLLHWIWKSRKHQRITLSVKAYGETALDCVLILCYLQAILRNPLATSYLLRNHSKTLQDLKRIVEDGRKPPSNETEANTMKKQMWTIPRARNDMQELIRRTKQIGPQVITRSGKPTAVVVSLSQWKQLTKGTAALSVVLPS